jgi:hypothetical protein
MLTVLGFAATIAFGLLSIFLYFRGKRNKRLTCTFDLTALQEKKHPDIRITFKGREIEKLSRLRVACWNNGNEAVRWSDIPQNGPPTIKFKQGTLLSVAYVGVNEETKTTAKQYDDHSLSFSFAYLNPRDWAFLEVLYEGSAKASEFEFIARIIGGRSTSRRYRAPSKLSDLLTVCLTGLFFFALGVSFAHTAFVKHAISGEAVGAVLMLGFSLGIFILIVIVERRARIPEPARSYIAGHSSPQLQTGSQNQKIPSAAAVGKAP